MLSENTLAPVEKGKIGRFLVDIFYFKKFSCKRLFFLIALSLILPIISRINETRYSV